MSTHAQTMQTHSHTLIHTYMYIRRSVLGGPMNGACSKYHPMGSSSNRGVRGQSGGFLVQRIREDQRLGDGPTTSAMTRQSEPS